MMFRMRKMKERYILTGKVVQEEAQGLDKTNSKEVMVDIHRLYGIRGNGKLTMLKA